MNEINPRELSDVLAVGWVGGVVISTLLLVTWPVNAVTLGSIVWSAALAGLWWLYCSN